MFHVSGKLYAGMESFRPRDTLQRLGVICQKIFIQADIPRNVMWLCAPAWIIWRLEVACASVDYMKIRGRLCQRGLYED